MNMGKVYLIGAGPGDEELITLKAVRVLKKCTAVMYDRLIGCNILRHLNEDCQIYYCGKEPGCHYKTQHEINDMLVKLSKEGHTVGRIKGGDPYVFGRGGEEALRLRSEGIEFEVIPGITSAISVLCYAGIPITQRGIARSFHVFAGKSTGALDINWESAVNINGTLVFLMGLENMEEIIGNLTSKGMDKSTPCAVIMRGTMSKQRKVTGTLWDISSKARDAGFKSPCIIVVGEVVKFSSELNWYEKMPLFGLNICVTRSKEQAGPLCEKLLELGAQVTQINSIKIEDTSHNLDEYEKVLCNYDYIVFNSVNSVNIFFDYVKKKGIDIRSIKANLAAIGPATQKSIRDRGLFASITAGEFVSEDLFDKLKAVVKTSDNILIPCSLDSRAYIFENLEKMGCNVDEVHIYKPLQGDMVNASYFNDVDVVLFTSPSTVKNMIKMAGIEGIKSKKCIAIGPITGMELQDKGISCFVCDEYTTVGIVEKLIQLKANGKL